MLKLDFLPFPILQTQRLILREITEQDLPELFAMRSNPQIMQHIARPLAKTMDDANTLLQIIIAAIHKNEGITWGISEKGNSKLIGTIGFWQIDKTNARAEIGYLLHPGYWRKAYMSEAIQTVLNYGFQTLHFHSVAGCVGLENIASQKTLLKNGFVKEAHFKEDCYFEGKYLDTLVYSIFAHSGNLIYQKFEG